MYRATSSRRSYSPPPRAVTFAIFGCPNCARTWESAHGSATDYQKCKSCLTPCYPSSWKRRAPNKRGNQERETILHHDMALCGVCERLGRCCIGTDAEEEAARSVNVVISDEGKTEVLRMGDGLSLLDFAVTRPMKKGNKKPHSKSSRRSQEHAAARDPLPELQPAAISNDFICQYAHSDVAE
ncbi:hypothetical protein WJX72_000429 [[Myrmecia] bisecta]|uniref:3CxxC-type domain-containing protein n=1 Tax=[Myrmecia] bisecta TaxID=41462 RepID=A0AAW1PNV4_9CHLO